LKQRAPLLALIAYLCIWLGALAYAGWWLGARLYGSSPTQEVGIRSHDEVYHLHMTRFLSS